MTIRVIFGALDNHHNSTISPTSSRTQCSEVPGSTSTECKETGESLKAASMVAGVGVLIPEDGEVVRE